MSGWYVLMVAFLFVNEAITATDNIKRYSIEDDEARVQQKFSYGGGIFHLHLYRSIFKTAIRL